MNLAQNLEASAFFFPDRLALRQAGPEWTYAQLKSRLSPFKVPKQCVVIDEFPKSPQGKILKRQLRKQFLEGAGQSGTQERESVTLSTPPA